MLELESVRLIHAHGLPNHYIANQLYVPTDGAVDRGTFLLLIHHKNTPNGMVVSSAISTLIRDYYRPGSPSGLDSFEHALLRLNEQLQHATNPSLAAGDLEGLIVLFYNDEIHASYLGNASASLVRDGQVLALTTHDDTTEKAGLRFSVITSGEVKAEDILFLQCGLDDTDKTATDDKSLLFAASHQPMYETGRALARIYQQNEERLAEAFMTRFNNDTRCLETIAVDKSLETTAEKVAEFQKNVSGIMSKVQEQTAGLRQFTQTLRPPKTHGSESKGPADEDVAPADHVSRDHSHKDTEEVLASSLTDTENQEAHDFSVTTYWQKLTHPAPTAPHEKHDHTHNHGSHPETPLNLIQTLIEKFLPGKAKPRTLYLLIGTLVLLFLVIQIYNHFSGPKTNTITSAQRDSLVTQAENLAKAADTAQAQDDNATAITDLTKTQTVLAQIPAPMQNDASKALEERTVTLLTTLTNSSTLALKSSVTSSVTVTKIIDSANGTYAFGPTAVQKISGTKLASVSGLTTTFIDAVPYDGGQKIAILGRASDGSINVTSLDTKTNKFADLNVTGNASWPTDSRLIASYQNNLYLVGSKVTKAIPSGTNYQIVNGNFSGSTANFTTFLNNDVAFYGSDDTNQITRIAADTPPNPIKLFGVPTSFWPTHIARLISTGVAGQLYLLDSEGNRILAITTDGGYKQQYKFPSDQSYTDCDASGTTFTCVTKDNKIATLQPGS